MLYPVRFNILDTLPVPADLKSAVKKVRPRSAYKTRKKKWELPFKKEFDAPISGHQTLYISKSTIVYFTATLMALSPNFAITMVSDTAQDAVPSTAEEEPISLPSAA